MYCKLKYQDDYLYSFRIDGEYSPRKTHIEGNQVILDEDRERTQVNGIEVIICYDKAFAYLKDSKPYVVTTEGISEKEYDEVLLGVCERMLSEGRFEFFEYICEYILKYDSKFIEPYLERYCVGDFSSFELQKMEDIAPDYITKCARQIENKKKKQLLKVTGFFYYEMEYVYDKAGRITARDGGAGTLHL